MFNPQRKVKVADIYMQEKAYSSHLQKIDQIEKSLSLRSKRYQEEAQQERYIFSLAKSKKQTKERLSTNVNQENERLRKKLIEADNRKELNTDNQDKRKHFNSYYSSKKQKQRVHQDNYGMVMRMNEQGSGIPSLKQLKKQYKKNRKLARNCRKLPAILRKEEEFKLKLSKPIIQQSRTLHMHLKT